MELTVLELEKLPINQQINKVATLYFKKCWKTELIKNGKFNFAAYNYIKKVIKEKFDKKDICMFYKYLLSIEYTNMSIEKALYLAKGYIQDEKDKLERRKLSSIKIKDYDDYSIDELCL